MPYTVKPCRILIKRLVCVCVYLCDVILQKEISAECEATGSPAKPASPKSFHLTVPESHTPFFFPHTRSRPPTTPTMPTLPEEEEDSPEEIDSSSSSPSSVSPSQDLAAFLHYYLPLI